MDVWLVQLVDASSDSIDSKYVAWQRISSHTGESIAGDVTLSRLNPRDVSGGGLAAK